jgi:hypothetical protein
MSVDISILNWWAIVACVVVGQIVLTVWFVVLFAKPWALAYGVDDPKKHTAEVPAYTYGIQVLCMALLSFGLAVLQQAMGVASIGGGLAVGLLVAVCFALATATPGYAFLRRWRAYFIAMGSQVAAILILSAILAVWR